jgi:sugar phosphate isomerase/epimerase
MSRQTRRTFFQQAALGCGVGATLGTAAVRGLLAAQAEAPPMKFAICNETFQDWPLEKACDLAAECGYTGLEIAPFTLGKYVTEIPAARRREVRKTVEKAGLKVAGLHWLLAKTEGLHLTSPDAAVRRKTAAYLGELARFCADLGGRIMVFGSPKQRDLAPGMTRQAGMNLAADVLRAAMPAMDSAGVTVGLEPLTPKETNFLNTAADGMELVGLVGSPHCRLHLDCKAMAGAEKEPIPALIHRYHKWLVHFHANDPNRRGPGFGALDFRPILKALREVGYGGWVSVEVFDFAPGPERLARQSIRYLRDCLATTSD